MLGNLPRIVLSTSLIITSVIFDILLPAIDEICETVSGCTGLTPAALLPGVFTLSRGKFRSFFYRVADSDAPSRH